MVAGQHSITMESLEIISVLSLRTPCYNSRLGWCSSNVYFGSPGRCVCVSVRQVACGEAPQIKRFFVVIYPDAMMSRPLQIWQFYVHAMQRVDIAGIEGQTSRVTLMLR